MSDFLPEDYEVPVGESNYMKWIEGDNKFRILQKPIFGWEGWKDKVPHRFPMDEMPTDLVQYKDSQVNHFWAMPVWNFTTERVEVLEITQKGIQGAIAGYANNEDWGSPLAYNITVNRKGTTMSDTEYSVTPSPKTDVPLEARAAFDEMTDFEITRLFNGGDPFSSEKKTQ